MMTMEPIKVLRDRRLSYLTGLEDFYSGLGYSTKLDARCNILEVYQKGYVVEKTSEELVIEKWID